MRDRGSLPTQRPVRRVLVVRAGRGAEPPAPPRQVRGLGVSYQAAVEANWACGWKRSRAPRIKALLGRVEAIPCMLIFLRNTRVGEMVPLAALGGGGVGADGYKRGRAAP